MATNIEMEALVTSSARNAADIGWIRFENRRRNLVFGQKITSREPSRSGADDRDGRF